MKNYERQVLVKFISIYFLSIAFFILILGYLYYQQHKNLILQKYTNNMHQYAMKLKHNNFAYIQDGYSFEIVKTDIYKNKLALKENRFYKKTFPTNKGRQFVVVSVKSKIIEKELNKMKNYTILLQILLLIFFFLLSLYLSKISLKPINDTISHLDRFLKDLIHDINTPITSILLNTTMLKKQINDESLLKKLTRVEHSANEMGSLYENLEVILKETLSKSMVNLYPVLASKKEFFLLKYSNILIELDEVKMEVNTNEKAIIRIIDNILSNACKYSQKEPLIQISFSDNTLTIKDNGKGMKYPEKIFERSYTENEQGHGIGMHIVQRLCNSLDIKIDVNSQENIGTSITLKFY